MSNTLKDLYFGNIMPVEQVDISDQDYKEAVGESTKRREELENSMDEYQLGLLEKYCNAEGRMNCELNALSFVEGFELAVKICCQVFLKE